MSLLCRLKLSLTIYPHFFLLWKKWFAFFIGIFENVTGSFVMPEGVLVKTEEMGDAVLDMPLLASPEPSKFHDLPILIFD